MIPEEYLRYATGRKAVDGLISMLDSFNAAYGLNSPDEPKCDVYGVERRLKDLETFFLHTARNVDLKLLFRAHDKPVLDDLAQCWTEVVFDLAGVVIQLRHGWKEQTEHLYGEEQIRRHFQARAESKEAARREKEKDRADASAAFRWLRQQLSMYFQGFCERRMRNRVQAEWRVSGADDAARAADPALVKPNPADTSTPATGSPEGKPELDLIEQARDYLVGKRSQRDLFDAIAAHPGIERKTLIDMLKWKTSNLRTNRAALRNSLEEFLSGTQIILEDEKDKGRHTIVFPSKNRP